MFVATIRYIIENIFFVFGFLGNGMNAFPKPLTAKEEKMYFDLYKEGNEDAKKELAEVV